MTARLEDLARVLSAALETWATRDDSIPQPEVREAANTACDAIDAMLAELHRARAALVAEVRQSDDAATVRAEALLARLRREFAGCDDCPHPEICAPAGTCGRRDGAK